MGLFNILKDKLSGVQQDNRENSNEKTAPSEVFERMKKKLEELESKPNNNQANAGASGGLFSVLKKKLEEVKNENRESPDEVTAEDSIFDKMKAELEKMESQKESYEGAAGSDDVWSKVPDSLEANKPKMDIPTLDDLPSLEVEKPTVESVEDEFGSVFDRLENDSNNNNKERGNYEQPSESGNYGGNIETGADEVAKGSRSFQVGSMANTDSNGGSLAMRIDPVMGAGTLSTRVPSNASIRILDFSDKNKINLDGVVSGWVKIDYKGQQGWILESYLF